MEEMRRGGRKEKYCIKSGKNREKGEGEHRYLWAGEKEEKQEKEKTENLFLRKIKAKQYQEQIKKLRQTEKSVSAADKGFGRNQHTAVDGNVISSGIGFRLVSQSQGNSNDAP